jgi:hypothetical protein
VEPEFDLLANRSLLLTGSSYSVTTVGSKNEVCDLPRDDGFSFAVLNDTLGQPALCLIAIYVRRTWPSARMILILKGVESGLEDHLYERIDYPFRPKALLDAIVKLADDPWNQRPQLFGATPGAAGGSHVPLPSSPSKPLESDTTKADILTTWTQRRNTHPIYPEESRAANERSELVTWLSQL